MFKTYSSSSSLVITSRWFATSRLVAPVSVRLVYLNNSFYVFYMWVFANKMADRQRDGHTAPYHNMTCLERGIQKDTVNILLYCRYRVVMFQLELLCRSWDVNLSKLAMLFSAALTADTLTHWSLSEMAHRFKTALSIAFFDKLFFLNFIACICNDPSNDKS